MAYRIVWAALAAVLGLTVSSNARAFVACIDNAVDFQLLLAIAQNNGEDDEIRLRAGTYSLPYGETSFQYATGQDYALKIVGGASGRDCDIRLAPDATVLSGLGVHQPLLLVAYANTRGSMAIENLTIADGYTSASGGGLQIIKHHHATGPVGIDRVHFVDNHSDGLGGALSIVTYGRLRLSNSQFHGNSADRNSGAASVTVKGEASAGYSAYIVNNTVAFNSCNTVSPQCDNGGIAIAGSARIAVANNAFVFNSGSDLFAQDPYYVVYHNNLSELDGQPPQASVGNMDVYNPLFVNLLGGNFRLRANSPLRDAGAAAFVFGNRDLDNAARVAGGQVDVGAFEYQHNSAVDGFDDTRLR